MFLEQSVLLVSRQEAKPNAILLLWYLYVHESESESHSVVSDSLWLRGLYSSWNSLGQNTGVGSLSLLQGLFPTQGSNPGLPHCRQILYHLSHQESPRILEWVAYPFSRGPSQPRNGTGVSCTAGRFFTGWLTTGLQGNSQETRFRYNDRNRFESERIEKDSPHK